MADPQLRPAVRVGGGQSFYGAANAEDTGVRVLGDLAKTLSQHDKQLDEVAAEERDVAARTAERELEADAAISAGEIVQKHPELAGHSDFVRRLTVHHNGRAMGAQAARDDDEFVKTEGLLIEGPQALQAALTERTRKRISALDADGQDGYFSSYSPEVPRLLSAASEARANETLRKREISLGNAVLSSYATLTQDGDQDKFNKTMVALFEEENFTGLSDAAVEQSIAQSVLAFTANPDHLHLAGDLLSAVLDSPAIADPKLREGLQNERYTILQRSQSKSDSGYLAQKRAKEERLDRLADNAVAASIESGSDQVPNEQAQALIAMGDDGLARLNEVNKRLDARTGSAQSTAVLDALNRVDRGEITEISQVFALADSFSKEQLKTIFDRVNSRKTGVFSSPITQDYRRGFARNPDVLTDWTGALLAKFTRAIAQLQVEFPGIERRPTELADKLEAIQRQLLAENRASLEAQDAAAATNPEAARAQSDRAYSALGVALSAGTLSSHIIVTPTRPSEE